MTKQLLKEYVEKSIRNRPELKEEITDLWQLCLDEIESGESESNEIELCQEAIRQLIEDEEES